MTYKEYFKKIVKEKDLNSITMKDIKRIAYYFDNENDFDDIQSIIELLKENEIDSATSCIGCLDTIVRDAVCNVLEECK